MRGGGVAKSQITLGVLWITPSKRPWIHEVGSKKVKSKTLNVFLFFLVNSVIYSFFLESYFFSWRKSFLFFLNLSLLSLWKVCFLSFFLIFFFINSHRCWSDRRRKSNHLQNKGFMNQNKTIAQIHYKYKKFSYIDRLINR